MHDHEPEIDPYPLPVSEPEFLPDAIEDKITLEPNQKERRVGSSSTKGTTNDRPEPESFGDVVPKQPHVGNKDRTNSIGKPVKATPEL